MTSHGEPRALLDSVLAMPSWPAECIDWPFGCDSEGYGRLRVGSIKRGVHQLACEHRHGPRPEGMEVRHLCGRGRSGCFNPAHLEWASHADNMTDTVAHGTHTRGERNGRHKLTDDQVAEIRRMYVGRGGPTQQSIADQYGVSRENVSMIVTDARWDHL